MSNYTVTTNFGAKDSIPSGNPNKLILGAQLTTEFANIATAVNSKVDSSQAAVLFSAGAAQTAEVGVVGNGGVSSARFAIQNDGSFNYVWGFNALDTVFGVNNAVVMRLNNASAATRSIKFLGPTSGSLIDMTPDTGTFTATVTGISGTTTTTVHWQRIGVFVTLIIGLTGASTSTALTFTGLPAALQTNGQNQIVTCNLFDNGSNIAGTALIANGSGTVTCFAGVVSGTSVQYSTAGFTASGSKGFNGTQISYVLA